MITINKVEYDDIFELMNNLNSLSASFEWRDFLKNNLGFEDHFLGIYKDGQLEWVIPAFVSNRRLEGVPKLYTDIININGKPKPIDEIIDLIKKDKQFKSIHLSLSFYNNRSETPDLKYKNVTHFLNLENLKEEDVLSKIINKKTRNQIKSAYKSGLILKMDTDLNTFYDLYKTSIRRLRSIPKNKKFFSDLQKSFKNNMVIISAFSNNELVAANLCLIKNKYLHIPFSVSRKDFFSSYPNNFVYWETIKYALNNGIKILDFGPSVLNDTSHHHFKEGFGAKAVPIFKLSFYNSFQTKLVDYVKRKARNLKLRINKLI